MTIHKIKAAALAHFARDGYDGASLANIAADVGIKKPSLYAHFKGKDDLFLTVIKDAVHSELHFLQTFLKDYEEQSLSVVLQELIKESKERYEQSSETKFWMRMMYFPPIALYDQVIEQVYVYLDQLESLLVPVFNKAIAREEITLTNSEQAIAAFLCLLEGVLVEMLYGGTERFAKRFSASWTVFWRGLSN